MSSSMISDGGLGAGGPPAIGVTPTGAFLGAAPVAATPTSAVVDDSLPYVSPFPAFRAQENKSLLSSSVAVQSDTPATVSVAQIDDDSIVVPITSWYHGVNNPP